MSRVTTAPQSLLSVSATCICVRWACETRTLALPTSSSGAAVPLHLCVAQGDPLRIRSQSKTRNDGNICVKGAGPSCCALNRDCRESDTSDDATNMTTTSCEHAGGTKSTVTAVGNDRGIDDGIVGGNEHGPSGRNDGGANGWSCCCGRRKKSPSHSICVCITNAMQPIGFGLEERREKDAYCTHFGFVSF